MTTQDIVMLLVGIAFFVLGFLLSTREKVAAWGLSHGHARIWVSMLGKERAMKLTKYFFGPVCMLFGVLAVLVTLVVLFGKP
jgi:uncharacterized membrane protein